MNLTKIKYEVPYDKFSCEKEFLIFSGEGRHRSSDLHDESVLLFTMLKIFSGFQDTSLCQAANWRLLLLLNIGSLEYQGRRFKSE